MKKLSYIAIGLIAGLVIGLTSSVYAQDVTAVFSKFIFKVNGVEKPLDADPLVYQGSTYLPVRTVANILGYDVTYKADSKTIELIQPTATGPTPSNTTGGVPVQGNPVEKDNYFTIETVNAAIQQLTGEIEGVKGMITSLEDKGFTQKAEETKGVLSKKEQELERLNGIKAQLESQAAPTPTP